MSQASIIAGRAYIELKILAGNLKAGLGKAQQMLKAFAAKASGALQMVYNGFYLIRDAILPVIRVFTGFDDQMRLTKAVTQATGEAFASLTAKAKGLGATTAFTAQQVAEGMTALGRMGFTAKEIEAAIPAVMDLSRATGTDLAQASDVAANTLRIFGMRAEKMSDVSDILTAAANGSAQTLTDLFEALKMAGPQASTAKESITDVAAAIGIMANVGIKGTMAGTALRRAYVNMASKDVQAYLARFNIQAVDASGNMRRMRDILYEVAQAMRNMGTAERMAFAEQVFDMRGSFVGLSLGGNIEGMDEFITKLENCKGVASKTATEMESGIGGAIRSLSSAWEGFVISMGSVASAFSVNLMGAITGTLRKITEFTAEMPRLSSALAGVGGTAGTAAVAMIALAAAVKTFTFAAGGATAAFTALKASMAFLLANPVVAVIAAIVAAIAGITYHIQKQKSLQDQLNKSIRKTLELQNKVRAAATSTPEEQRKAIEAVIAQLRKQQEIELRLAGSRAAIKRSTIIEKYNGLLREQYNRLNDIDRKQNEISNAPPPAPAAASAGPTVTQLMEAREKIAQLEEKMRTDALTETQRRQDAIKKENELYRQQLEIIRQGKEAERKAAEQRRANLDAKAGTASETPWDPAKSAALLNKTAEAAKEYQEYKSSGLSSEFGPAYFTQKEAATVEANPNGIYLNGHMAELARRKIALDQAAKAEAEYWRASGLGKQQMETITAARKALEDKTARQAAIQKQIGRINAGYELGDLPGLERQASILGMEIENGTKALDKILADATAAAATQTKSALKAQAEKEYARLGELDKELQDLADKAAESQENAEAEMRKIEAGETERTIASLDADAQARQDAAALKEANARFEIATGATATELASIIEEAAAELNKEAAAELENRQRLQELRDTNPGDSAGAESLASLIKASWKQQDFLRAAIASATQAKDSAAKEAESPDKAFGSFSLAAIMGMAGADTAAEETRRNTERTAKGVERLASLVSNLELTFG